jgi:NAD(P)H-hydrate epimerase
MQKVTEIPRLAPRKSDAHKGDFGRVLIVAGSVGMSGAAAIAGRAALRAGAGLVRVAVPRSILATVAAIEPCFTTIPLAGDAAGRISKKAVAAVLKATGENDVLAFGPGVGVGGGVKSVLQAILALAGSRVVIDADGLNNLAQIRSWPKLNKARLILTPHPGEMKRLWPAVFRDPLGDDRTEIAARFAAQTKTIVCLKGAGTVVTDGQKLYINSTGNPGMATAGAGDVLTGVITALCGQGLSSFDAAVLGVYIHGLAGDIAAVRFGQISLVATDILEALPEAFMKSSAISQKGKVI